MTTDTQKKKQTSSLDEKLSQKEELKRRAESIKKMLEAKIADIQANSIHSLRSEKGKLESEIEHFQELIADGWEKITEKTSEKINQWLIKMQSEQEESESVKQKEKT